MSTREAFEKWAVSEGWEPTRATLGEQRFYRSLPVQCMWDAWQAATLRAVRICEHQAGQAITSTGSARASFCADRIAGGQT